MTDTNFEEWRAQMERSFQTNIRSKEEDERLSAMERIFSNKIVITTDLITFDVKGRLLPRQRRLLLKYKEFSSDNYDDLQDMMSTILEELAIDSKFTKQFWIDLDEETGYLPTIFAHTMKQINDAEEQGITFR